MLRRVPLKYPRRRFHELPALELRATRGEPIPLDAVAESLRERCAAAAHDPSTAGSADEWLAAGHSALRIVEHSGAAVDARLGRLLHTVLLRGGATEQSVGVLEAGVGAGTLHEEELRGITTQSLKRLVKATSRGPAPVAAAKAADSPPAAAATVTASEEGHWDLLRALQDRGLACERHHTLVLHACRSREEVHRVLRSMKLCGIVSNLPLPLLYPPSLKLHAC